MGGLVCCNAVPLNLGAKGTIEIKDATFKLTLSDILIFTTGVPTEPPLGFSPGLSIRFTDGMFPCANTCINALYLPLSSAIFDEFTHNMCFGMLNTAGFGHI